MKTYIVSTHVGDFTTPAIAPKKALSNIRYRIFRRSPAALRHIGGWTVRECA